MLLPQVSFGGSPIGLSAAVLLFAGLTATAAHALPTAPEAFCSSYPSAPGCSGTIVACNQCHQGPPLLNAFGGEVAGALYSQSGYPGSTSFESALAGALTSIEALDSDLDGISNLEEISMGTLPGDPTSAWTSPATPDGLENPYFKVGEYDPAFALRRVGITYCGQAP